MSNTHPNNSETENMSDFQDFLNGKTPVAVLIYMISANITENSHPGDTNS